MRKRISPYLALVPVCIGVFIAADDQTVIVTVLPQIMVDMKVQVNELDRISWTITGYLLGYVAIMPLIGRVSDVWGHRRVYSFCLIVFIIGSGLVALMPTLNWLVAARILQAVGAGALVPISIAIVGDLFPSGRRGVPLGIVGACAEAGGVIGPLWGSIIINYLDWRWVFWINIPLGVVVLIGLIVFVRPSPRWPATIDYVGGGLITITLVATTLGLGRISSPDTVMAICLSLATGSLVLLIWWQKMKHDPILPTAMFKSLAFNSANVTHFLVGGALIIGMVTIPLMANTVMQLSPMEGGMLLMRLMAGVPVGAIIGGMLCQRMDYRIPVIIGLILAAIGFAFMSLWGPEMNDPATTIQLVIAGIGFGLLIAPIALGATNSVDSRYRGTAAGVVTATRIVGMTFGLAAITAWGTGRFYGLVANIALPFPRPGENIEQSQLRVEEFGQVVTDAGLTVFNGFFLVALVLCLIALIPAAFMVRRKIHNDANINNDGHVFE